MNEIIINKTDVASLKNEKLKSALLAIQRDCTTVNEKLWKVAEGVHKIVTKKLWSEDFTSETDLAAFMGTSVTTISRLKNAYQAKLDHPEISARGFEPSKVFELLPLKDKINEVIIAEDITPDETQKSIREAVGHYKTPKSGKKEKNCADANNKEHIEEISNDYEYTIAVLNHAETVLKQYKVSEKLYKLIVDMIKEYEEHECD